MTQKHYRVLVTRDTTESALIPVRASSPEAAAECATARDVITNYGHLFAANDGNSEQSPYLGDPDGDVEQITEDDYRGLVSSSEPPAVPIVAPIPVKLFEMVISARTLNEFADGPAYAVVTVDQSMIDRLIRLRRICVENELEAVTDRACPDRWEREGDLYIRGDNLRVTHHGAFWFEAHLKHTDYGVETLSLDIDAIMAVIEQGQGPVPNEHFMWSEGRLYYAACRDELPGLIEMVKGGSDE
ncbi:MAG: hypothetical protein JAZ11_02915 [Candidatus Thiodiazotropha lotti]|nr:hypothetical protein [Candidatus Thiodiazotropha lotti]